MAVELTAKTPPGERLVVLAEALAEELRPAAASHDQDRSYAFEGLETIKASGYLSAPVPVKLGGLGVSSTHDLLVAASRLARGDAALTIGVNMHITYVLNLERRYRLAVDLGNVRNIEALAASLEALAQDGHVYAAAVSEPRQDLIRPETVAAAIDNGWIVTGTKIFCTMSPGADRLYTAVTFLDRQGRESYGYATVPTDAPGVVIHDDWDALGMRASGSNSVTFENVRLPADALRGGFPVGHAGEYMERNLDAGLFHAAAALGIAEEAHHFASRRMAANGRAPAARAQSLVADNAVDLAAGRGTLSRAGSLLDDSFRSGWKIEPMLLFGEVQAAKAFIAEAAVRIVDRALALSGGAGYLNSSPLSRAYRDVRATAFMHPLGANRAYDYLAELELGRIPSLR